MSIQRTKVDTDHECRDNIDWKAEEHDYDGVGNLVIEGQCRICKTKFEEVWYDKEIVEIEEKE